MLLPMQLLSETYKSIKRPKAENIFMLQDFHYLFILLLMMNIGFNCKGATL